MLPLPNRSVIIYDGSDEMDMQRPEKDDEDAALELSDFNAVLRNEESVTTT